MSFRNLHLSIITAICSGCGLAAEPSPKPNIVLIFADDLGWKDTGFAGNDFHETPRIDRLASEGMVFTNGYAAAGNCAPSRACLLSGTYTPRHHVFAVNSTARGPVKFHRLVPIPNKSGLSKDVVTLADALRTAGYATGIFGKWHLDGKDGAEPADQGFEVVFDPMGRNPNHRKANPDDPKGVFSITRHASAFMEKSVSEKRPFFAYVSHHAIHSVLQARPGTLARFKAKTPGQQHSHPLYAACTFDLDAAVGLMLDHIKNLGIEGNTLVVFTSDNGGTQQSSQEPLRGSKGGYYEGGIREPFIIRWPGRVKAGTTCDTPVINIDFFPTFLAAAGVPCPDGKTLDGENLLPVADGGGSLKRQAIFWHFPGYLDKPVRRGRPGDVSLGFRSRPVSVIRKGDWKLHLFHEEWQLDGGRARIPGNHAVELYHIGRDIGEHNDLAATETAKRDELLDDLLSWIERTNAPIPAIANSAYDPAAAAKALAIPARKAP